jgi:glycosyltransferase involved in cell wall biosynthesis
MARTAGLYRGVEFQATSEDEARSIEEWIGRDVVQHRVPNLPRKVTYAQRPERRKKAGEVKLVNVVRIATEKNIDLIIESLADVRGDVHFDLHGPIHHTAYWEKCLKLIGDLPGNVHFNYHGPVPSEKVPALFAQDHHALFMPNEGDNFGHTMLEAMCSGLPLLISDRTPWRGLAERHVGWDLPLEGAAKFTEAIQRLVAMDQTEFDRWSAGAYAYGMEQVNDPATVAANLKLFQA